MPNEAGPSSDHEAGRLMKLPVAQSHRMWQKRQMLGSFAPPPVPSREWLQHALPPDWSHMDGDGGHARLGGLSGSFYAPKFHGR